MILHFQLDVKQPVCVVILQNNIHSNFINIQIQVFLLYLVVIINVLLVKNNKDNI